MATVQSTSTATDPFAAINAAGKSATASTSAVADQQDRFLKLLVTQLKNQDPLNPMDNAQMTSQLAQMSTVSGIEKLNATLNSLVDSVGNSQSMQAADMIGKSVLVPGSQLALSNGVAYAGINLAAAADQVDRDRHREEKGIEGPFDGSEHERNETELRLELIGGAGRLPDVLRFGVALVPDLAEENSTRDLRMRRLQSIACEPAVLQGGEDSIVLGRDDGAGDGSLRRRQRHHGSL